MPINQHNKIKYLDRITIIRKELALHDDVDFANAIKYSQGYISEILSGKKPVPKTMGQRLEDNLNINRRWFETGSGEMFAQTGIKLPDKTDRIIDADENPLSNKPVTIYQDKPPNSDNYSDTSPQYTKSETTTQTLKEIAETLRILADKLDKK